MKAKTPMNNWLMLKILSYLTAKQGFSTESSDFTVNGIEAIIKDVFGYRYEVNIKTLSRITDYSALSEDLHAEKPDYLDLLSPKKAPSRFTQSS